MYMFVIYKFQLGGVMVGMIASSSDDCRLDHWSNQTKNYKLSIYCSWTEHAQH